MPSNSYDDGEDRKAQKKRQHAHRRFLNQKSRVYQAFLAMESATHANGALPQKTKELMSVCIPAVIDCESCTEWPITQAVRAGASRQELLEAVEVAMEMAGGFGLNGVIVDRHSLPRPGTARRRGLALPPFSRHLRSCPKCLNCSGEN